MKKLNYLTLLFVAAGLSVVSCKQNTNNPDSPKDETTVSFTSKINPATKVNASNFENGDKIGVTAMEGSSVYADNVEYEYSSNKFVSDNGITYPDGGSLSFQAIYPYFTGAADSFTFSVKEDQSSQENYEASDLMIARTGTTKDATPVLAFDHTLSLVVVNIVETDETLADVSLEISAKTDTAVDLGDNTYTVEGSVKTIKATANGTNSYKAVVAPQTVEANSTFITMSIDGNTYSQIIPKNMELKSGFQYEFDAKIAEGALTFDYKINPWDTEEPSKPDQPDVPGGDEIIEFEDSQFLNAILAECDVDTNRDNQISKAEAAAAKYIYVPDYGIEAVTELQYFTNIEQLNIDFNEIEGTVDLNNCTKLTYFDCAYNYEITNLIFDKCTKLTFVRCSNNKISEIKVDDMTELTFLSCGTNPIKSLNLSKMSKLTAVYCTECSIKELDITNSPEIGWQDWISDYSNEGIYCGMQVDENGDDMEMTLTINKAQEERGVFNPDNEYNEGVNVVVGEPTAIGSGMPSGDVAGINKGTVVGSSLN